MIAAVVVTHTGTTLERCLEALERAGDIDLIVVVDNGGTDRAYRPRSGTELRWLKVANLGFGAAANEGCGLASREGATLIAVLNDDVFVDVAWVRPLAAVVDAEPTVGAAQPKLLIDGSSPARVNSLGVQIDRYAAGSDIGDGQPDDGSTSMASIDFFTGGAVMFATDFLEATGGFDERFFLYYEDLDLCARGRALGWEYRLAPESVVAHARGAPSTSADAARTLFLQERNRLWFAFRHADVVTVARALWLSMRRLRHAPRRVHLRALAAGLAGAPSAINRRARSVNRIDR